MTSCPQCQGINSQYCYLCNPRRRLHAGTSVSFLEFGRNLWHGVVTAVRPGEVYVRWSDGECGRFVDKYTRYLKVAA